MKPANWRRYYSPRPDYAYLGKLSGDAVRAQEKAYLEWLRPRITLEPADIEAKRAELAAELGRLRAELAAESPGGWRDYLVGRVKELEQRLSPVGSRVLAEEALEEKIQRRARPADYDATARAVASPGMLKIRELVDCFAPTMTGMRVEIRAVRNHSGKCAEIYGFHAMREGWYRMRANPRHNGELPRSDAPTTYSVFIDGRCVNSFLSLARAKQWAREHLPKAQAA